MDFWQVLLWILAILVVVFLATVFFGAPFVPTHQKQLKKLQNYLKLSKNDVLVDLGSGDGRVLRTFAPKIKQAIGYEINPFLVLLSRIISLRYKNIEIKMRDFRLVGLPEQTTVVFVFYANTFKKNILEMVKNHQKPLIFISYGFEFDELGEPEKKFGFLVYRIDKN